MDGKAALAPGVLCSAIEGLGRTGRGMTRTPLCCLLCCFASPDTPSRSLSAVKGQRTRPNQIGKHSSVGFLRDCFLCAKPARELQELNGKIKQWRGR
jgi:hypothetical protein